MNSSYSFSMIHFYLIMMFKVLVFLVLTSLQLPLIAATYTVIAPSSSVSFAIQHIGRLKVHGVFKEFDGVIDLNLETLSSSNITGQVKVSSLDTNSKTRDRHLMSDEFFNEERYPMISFESSSIMKNGNTLFLTGDITINGFTKPLSIPLETTPSFNALSDADIITVKGSTGLKRSEFGMDTYKRMIGDDVDIDLNIQLKHITESTPKEVIR